MIFCLFNSPWGQFFSDSLQKVGFVVRFPVQAFLTCVVWLSAALSCHGATLPGREKRILPSLTISSDTKVTLMRTVAPGGRLPTLMVNTSCSGNETTASWTKPKRFQHTPGCRCHRLQYTLNATSSGPHLSSDLLEVMLLRKTFFFYNQQVKWVHF